MKRFPLIDTVKFCLGVIRHRSVVRRKRRTRATAFLQTLEVRKLLSASPVLLADVNQRTADVDPLQLTNVNGTLYFVADIGGAGSEVWKTDGTTSSRVTDINPGSGSSDPKYLTNVNGTLYFQAFDPTNGEELWKTDGTTTVRVADINPGSAGAYPKFLTNVNGTLYFSASNGFNNGVELWKTDGTTTVQVAEINPGFAASNPKYLSNVNGTLYFSATNGTNGTELWKSNGTTTVQVADISSGGTSSNPKYLTNVNGTLYFSATNGTNGTELWKSDGTTAVRVADIVPGGGSSFPKSLMNVNGTLYFIATTAANGAELWKSDGTTTVQVADINPGSGSSNLKYLTNVNGTLYFSATNGANERELWKTDGTTTVRVADINPGSGSSNPYFITNVNGTLFFLATDGTNGYELWKSDGTTATRVTDINPGSGTSAPENLTNVNGTLYFTATDGTNGTQLWSTDGTTVRLIDVSHATASSHPAEFVECAGITYFVAEPNEFAGSQQLWRTDGTSTTKVSEMRGVDWLTNVNGTLYFRATDDSNDSELWKSDGVNTVRVADINSGSGSSVPAYLTNVNGTLCFVASDATGDRELWKTDGTNTVRVKDINPGISSSLASGLTNVNGVLYFRAYDPTNGTELWKSDGTTTVLVDDVVPGNGSSIPDNLTNVNGTLFFAAQNELRKTDGTSTVRIPFGGSDPEYLTNVNGTLFFSAHDGTNGRELWKSDGTTAVRVADIYPGTGWGYPRFLTNVDGTLFFSATDGVNGGELWKSDGTTTVRVADINPGAGSSNPVWLTNVNGLLYFSATDGMAGDELWMTDGMTTVRVADINPGSGSSSPGNLALINGALYFSAEDGLHGFEPFVLRGSAPTAVTFVSTTNSLAENTDTTNRIRVADIRVTDDGLGTNTLSVTGLDAASFEIVGSSLYLKAGTTLDFESKASYAVTVTVDDVAVGSTPDASANFVLSVANVNEAPTALVLANTRNSLPENANTTNRIRVADVQVTDDVPGTNVLSLSGADEAFFEIDSGVLYLKAGVTLDHVGKPAYEVTVAVDDASVGATPDASANFILTITHANAVPTAVLLENTTALPENVNTTTRVRVADIVVSDDDIGTNVLFVSGADADLFEIVGASLYVKAGTAFNYEAKSSYSVTVNVDDVDFGSNPDASTDLTLSITDVDEPPTAVRLENATTSLPENSDTSNRTRLANIAVDDDALGTNMLSLSGADAASFEIEAGVLYLKAGVSLNFEGKSSYAVTVNVDGSAVGSTPDATTNFTLGVTDVNEPPTGVSLTNLIMLPENTSTTSRVRLADIAVVDDALGTNGLTLSGADGGLLEIVGTQLFLRAGTRLDFETHPVLHFNLVVDDTAIGVGPDASAPFSIQLTDVSEAATVIGGFSGSVTYAENAVPVVLATNVTVTDADSPNYAFGTLTLAITQNGEAGDRLAIRHQGNSSGQIGVNGSNVTLGGALIGTWSGGQGNVPLTIDLTATCTPAALKTLIQNLTYSDVSDTPLAAARRIELRVRGGDGMISSVVFKTVAVTPMNDAPTIAAFAGPAVFTEGGSAVIVDSDATIADPDSPNFDTGKLTVKIGANGHADDRLALRNEGVAAGEVGVQVVGTNTNVTFGGVLIGTLAGGVGTTPLVVTFRAAANAAAVQAVLRNVLFSNVSANPPTLPRTLQASLTDGDGGTSAVAAATVTIQAVNTSPVVTIGGNIAFSRTGPAALISPAGTVTDPDSAHFNGGRLIVQVTTNVEANDQLRVVNQGTAAGKIGVAGNLITFGGVNNVIGTSAGGDGGAALVITFTSNLATPAAVQALLRDITFGSASVTPSVLLRTLQVTLEDGDGGTSPTVAKTIDVIHNTVISGWDGTTAWTEGMAPAVIDTSVTLTDPDTAAFDGFVLRLALLAYGTADDRLSVRHQGGGSSQIGFDGTNVHFQGTLIGTTTGGEGLTPLAITMNASATRTAVQMLIQNLTFASVSDTPATAPRTLQLQVVDPEGYVNPAVVKTVTVKPTNDAPTLGAFDGTSPFVEAAGAVALDADATVVDPDSPNFDTGKLTVKISANGHADDRLTLRNEGMGVGQIGVQTVGATTNVTFGGVLIGTLSGGAGTTPFVVTFKAAADAAAVQAVLRCVLFSNVSANPTTLPRTLQASLTDGDGGTSLTASKTITVQAVNTPPTVVVGPAVNALRSGPAVLLAPTATVADPDSTNFNSGRLTVELAANAEGSDQLRITNQGTSSGKIGIAGNAVTFGGVNNVIGTFTGGDGATPLVITFTSDLANATSVQALLRAITFANSAVSPLQRTLQVTLEDGDGAASAAVTKPVNIVKNTTIGGWDGSMGYTENSAPVLIDSAVTLTDPDTSTFDGFALTAAFTTNGTSDDRLGVRHQGNGTGQIAFDGTNVRYQGTLIGTASGGIGVNPLSIMLQGAATNAAVKALIQNLTFSNVSDAPSTFPRSVTLLLTDTAGYSSAAVSKAVTVTAVNDAPVLAGFGGATSYTSSGQAVLIDDDATVADADRLDFATGKLTLQLTNNAQSTDRLRIRSAGSGVGEIGVSGSNVTYGGIVIGTFTGGGGTTALVITLNANADALAVQALLRNIEFASTSFTPSLLPRMIKATLTDGDGGASNMPTKTINVV